MKMVMALVQHTRFDAVRKALTDLGVQGMTVADVRGFGRQKGFKEVYRGMQYDVRFMPKVKIETAIPDDKLDAVLQAIQDAARTGEVGDGKIFVYDLNECIRIRTGEKGEGAL
ncbi:MAG: P-II family nitrogen regulator [Nitrospiraceae bacterium]|nr:P-II family nitrogen regulator [Nitrospiraceae bacterium]